MSNGPQGDFEVSVYVCPGFGFSESWWQRGAQNTMNFDDFCASVGSKIKNQAQKNYFDQNFDQIQNIFFDFTSTHIFGFYQISDFDNFGVKNVGPP